MRGTRPPLILLAGDDAATATIERVLTHHGYTVLRIPTGRDAVGAARAAQPDLIVVTATVPDTSGYELCRALRDDTEIGPRTPILMTTTAAPTADSHRAALRAGVWEFLTQPMHDEELRARIDNYVLMTRDPAAGEAEWDENTGMYAPAGLTRRARELALQAFHHHGGLACVLLSPTRATDAPRLARCLRQAARRSDAIGRIDTGDFAIVAPGTDAHGARLLAERLARELRGGSVDDDAGPPELWAGFDAVDNARRTPLTPHNLLARAAAALTQARQSGQREWIQSYE